jgi:hypothetical protein
MTRTEQQLFVPAETKHSIRRDRVPLLPPPDPGIDGVIEAGRAFLQSHATSRVDKLTSDVRVRIDIAVSTCRSRLGVRL